MKEYTNFFFKMYNNHSVLTARDLPSILIAMANCVLRVSV
jgi:hypothetical protein